jgi:hypothetical protein
MKYISEIKNILNMKAKNTLSRRVSCVQRKRNNSISNFFKIEKML